MSADGRRKETCYQWFQGAEEECWLDEEHLRELVETVKLVNPKLYLLQELAGDL